MFRELRDLIIEGLHLILLYGFLCVCAIGVIIMVVANLNSINPQTFHYAAHPPEPIIQREHSEKSLGVVERERICNRIEGCVTYTNAKTPEEYCPTCEWILK